jgi:hypothetical protein
VKNKCVINRYILISILILAFFLNLVIVFEVSLSDSKLPVTIIYKINSPYMTVNGKSLEIDPVTKATPLIVNEWGRAIIPIRSLIEVLDDVVEWNAVEKKVLIKFKNTIIELWVNSPKVRIDGLEFWIDSANHNVRPIIVNGRTMVPLRFVAENIGCKVEWFSKERIIKITFPSPLMQVENREIIRIAKGNEKLSFDVPIANPFNWRTKIKVRLISNDCPKDWSSDFCVKNTCYFKEGEIVLEKKEKTVIQISIYTTSVAKANYTLIISGEEFPEESLYISLKEE